jgi:hypothetical protein
LLAEQIVADLGAALVARTLLRLRNSCKRCVGTLTDRRFAEVERFCDFGIALLLREQQAKYRSLVGGEIFDGSHRVQA